MAAARFVTTTNAAVALVAATAKTVLAVTGPSARAITPTEISVSFDGVTATAVPVLVELVQSDASTAGTSTSATPVQVGGTTGANTGSTSAINYSAEPTVLTPIRKWLVTPNGGLLIVQFPLGREPEPSDAGRLVGLRLTAPAAVNCHANFEWEE